MFYIGMLATLLAGDFSAEDDVLVFESESEYEEVVEEESDPE